jgi:hypothetical protein
LFSREKVGSNWQYEFYVSAPADKDVYPIDEFYEDEGSVYVLRTFLVPDSPVGSIVSVRAQEDERSVLTVNNGQITGSTTYFELNGNAMEPAIVVPLTRKVTQVNLYNEFRASDPAQRNKLPPDFFQDDVFPGEVLEFNDGYNCNVTYNAVTQTLRFNGGVGFGLGRPDSNPWDDTDEDFDDGVRDVNGVNTLGVVPIEVGAGLTLDTSVAGELRILVSNQGDLACPPE